MLCGHRLPFLPNRIPVEAPVINPERWRRIERKADVRDVGVIGVEIHQDGRRRGDRVAEVKSESGRDKWKDK